MMASQASSSSSSLGYAGKYDVFLSFWGEDTSHGFVGNLYSALHRKGIRAFLDDKELQRGLKISQARLKIVQESRVAIIVFSENYASASYCLDELSLIIECMEANGCLVLPVFYDVDPSDVRHQRGSYAKALAKQEQRFEDDKEKLSKWRMALHQAANLSGWQFKSWLGYEYVLIEKIVEVVFNKINRNLLDVENYPEGLESHVLKVNWLLGAGSNDGVDMVGIYGISGIGKTTLARALYNLIADEFEGFCFLENVRENSITHGLVHLQETLLSKIFGEDIKLGNVIRGISVIKQRLREKKVLLILDNVDKRDQLWALVGGLNWFGPGSRVIVTTRDKHLLASHGIKTTYEVSHNILEGMQTSQRVLQAGVASSRVQVGMKWRFVGVASGGVGLLCNAWSPSFKRLIGGWNSFKLSLYVVLALVICAAVAFAKQSSLSTQHVKKKAYLGSVVSGFVVLIITSLYSFFDDKAMGGKPGILNLVSNGAFAMMSLSWSKVMKFGFERDLLSFFLGSLVVQLVSINLKLILVAIIFGCPLYIYSNFHSQPEPGSGSQVIHSTSDPEVDDGDVGHSSSDPEVDDGSGGRQHVIHINK